MYHPQQPFEAYSHVDMPIEPIVTLNVNLNPNRHLCYLVPNLQSVAIALCQNYYQTQLCNDHSTIRLPHRRQKNLLLRCSWHLMGSSDRAGLQIRWIEAMWVSNLSSHVENFSYQLLAFPDQHLMSFCSAAALCHSILYTSRYIASVSLKFHARLRRHQTRLCSNNKVTARCKQLLLSFE